MSRRTKMLVAVVSATLAFAGAAGAAGTGLLTITVHGGSHAAGGIQVHGKWKLVVHARNGKVVATRRFENALTSDGAYELMGLLTGGTLGAFNSGHYGGSDAGVYWVVGGQGVQLDDGTAFGSGQGCNLIPLLNPCLIEHTNGGSPYVPGYTNSDCSGPMCTTATDARGTGSLHLSASGSALTMSGTVTPYATTTFKKVITLLKVCFAKSGSNNQWQADPGDCANDNGDSHDQVPFGPHWLPFTSKTLSPNLTVQAGQSVSVSVQLSFS